MFKHSACLGTELAMSSQLAVHFRTRFMMKAVNTAIKGEDRQAEIWLSRLEEAAGAEPRLAPDVVSCLPSWRCARTNEADRAELWFCRMVIAGVCPDMVSLDIFGGSSPGQHVKLDVFDYDALVAAAARASLPETAEK
jgi:hypothetical protein